MKIFFSPWAFLSLVLLMSGCAVSRRTHSQGVVDVTADPNQTSATSSSNAGQTPNVTAATDTNSVTVTDPNIGTANTTPPTGGNRLPPPANAQGNQAPRYPYGMKVAGRPGFVTSPYAQTAGLVDVRDPATQKPYARGTEVRCPYTGKIFLVP